jgi:hypothetical protein
VSSSSLWPRASRLFSVGSEGLEPSPTWLRARHAASNTLIPCSCFVVRVRAQWARRESNPRPGPYKRPALTTELRAAAIAGRGQRSGAEGSRTLTFPLKRRKRCRYATTPSVEWAYAFEWRGLHHVKSPVVSCPRWSRTTAGDVSDRYASVTTPDSREGGSRTRGLVLPRHARHRSSSSRFHFFVAVTRVGFEPNLFSLKG